MTTGQGDEAYPKSISGKPVALESRSLSEDGRRYSPSTGRNKDVVRDTFLKEVLSAGHVLEIASGTGEHGAHIAQQAPDIVWTYSDIDPDGHVSQTAWSAAADHNRLQGPLTIDTIEKDWANRHSSRGFDAVFCANMIHIAPFAAAVGLIAGAGKLLGPSGRLVLYGPFARAGEIAPSNARFSEDLKRRDLDWGVRDLDLDIEPLARVAGFRLHKVIAMPANNLTVIFEKA